MKFKRWIGKIGDRRPSSWFALLPVSIGDEVRWLERVTVMWELRMVPDFFPPCAHRPRWVKIGFMEESDQ